MAERHLQSALLQHAGTFHGVDDGHVLRVVGAAHPHEPPAHLSQGHHRGHLLAIEAIDANKLVPCRSTSTSHQPLPQPPCLALVPRPLALHRRGRIPHAWQWRCGLEVCPACVRRIARAEACWSCAQVWHVASARSWACANLCAWCKPVGVFDISEIAPGRGKYVSRRWGGGVGYMCGVSRVEVK